MIDILLIVITIFALFAWSRALLRFKDKVISFRAFLFWSVIWGGAIVFTALRKRIGFVADVTGIQRPVDVLLYCSVILLFYLMFRLYVKIDALEQNLTKVVREVAIRLEKKEKKK